MSDRAYSRVGRPHRELFVDSRGAWQRGDDVAALQAACNRRLRARGLDRYCVPEHGAYTPATAIGCRKALYLLGAMLSTVRSDRLGVGAQRMIRHPGTRVGAQLDRARYRLERLRARRRRGRPNIYRHADAGLSVPTRSFGDLGALRAVTVHHSAGPRASDRDEAVARNRQYDRDHRAKGWGGLGYHETIDDDGNLYVSYRATGRLTGAHVGGWNTGNYGLLLHGNYEHDEPTDAALATLRWRIRHGHEAGLADLRGLPVRGHRDWHGHESNACPGRNLYPKVKTL